MNNLLPKNIEFLLKYLKKEYGINKNVLVKELNISRSTLHSWIHGGNISKKNLNQLVNFFNKYMLFEINVDDLLNKDLEKELKISKSIDSINNGHLDEFDILILKYLKNLSVEDKKIVAHLLKKISNK